MSLLTQKARPLKRDLDTFRDDRLFIIACDDRYAPKQYFEFFRIPRVKIHVVPTIDGTGAEHVLERLKAFGYDDDDERWLVLDTDHFTTGSHLRTFLAAIQDAGRSDIQVALSKPSFELWLLLHLVEEDTVRGFVNASAVGAALRKTLGSFSKLKLNSTHFPLATVPLACERAKRLDENVSGGDIPQENTSRVYKLWEAILAKALPTHVPVELRCLLPPKNMESLEVPSLPLLPIGE